MSVVLFPANSFLLSFSLLRFSLFSILLSTIWPHSLIAQLNSDIFFSLPLFQQIYSRYPATKCSNLGMSFGSATIDLYTNKYTGGKPGTSSHGTAGETSANKGHSSLSSAAALSSSLGSSYTSSLGDYGRSADFHYSSPSASSFLPVSNYGTEVSSYYSPLSRPSSAALHHSHHQYGASSVSSFQPGSTYHSSYSSTPSTYSSLKVGPVASSSSSIPKRPSTRSSYSSIRSGYSQRKPTTTSVRSSALVNSSTKLGSSVNSRSRSNSISDRIGRGNDDDVKSSADKEPQTNGVLGGQEDGNEEQLLSTDDGEEEAEEEEEDETEADETEADDSEDVVADETNSECDNREEAVDDTEFGVKLVSRSTSPLRAHDTDTNCNKESQQQYRSSDNQTESNSTDCCNISSIEQKVVVRPKKHIFGTDAPKCHHHQATQVSEDDLLRSPTSSRSADLSSKYLSSTTWTGVHGASASRRTYGNGSYARASTASRSTNRYSAPVTISSYTSRSTHRPLSPTSSTSVDAKSPVKCALSVFHSVSPSSVDVTTTSADTSSESPSSPISVVLNVRLDSLKPYSKGSGDESGSDTTTTTTTATTCDSSCSTSGSAGVVSVGNSNHNNNNSFSSHSTNMHINNNQPASRLSPRIIRRSINYKSPSPRPNSAASSETEDEQQTSGSECSKKKMGRSSRSGSNQSSSPSSIVVRLNCPKPSSVSASGGGNSSNRLISANQQIGSNENLNCCNSQLLNVEQGRCASAEPLTTLFGSTVLSTGESRSADHKSSHSSSSASSSSVSTTSSSSSLSNSSEHIALRPPNYPSLPSLETPLIVVNKLPIIIKDPYSTESESEFGAESEDEEASNTVTIRLSSANSNYSAYSETIVNGDSLKEDDELSEEEDDEHPQPPLQSTDGHLQGNTLSSKVNHSESENDASQSSTTSADEQESENQIDKAISVIENEVSSLKESSNNLIHPRSSTKVAVYTAATDNRARDALQDSGYSENLNRSNSSYDNTKHKSTSSTAESSCTSSDTECASNNNGAPMNCDSSSNSTTALDKQALVERCQQELSAFISKCKDIDEMIGPLSPGSPTYLHVFQGARARLSALSEEPESDDSAVVPLDASHVKVHQATRMQSTVSSLFFNCNIAIFDRHQIAKKTFT